MTSPIELPQPFIEDCNELGWEPYRDFQLVYFLPDKQYNEEYVLHLANQTRSLMNDYFLPSLTLSCSEGGFSTQHLQEALLQCKTASMYSFYLPEMPVIYYTNIHLFGLTSIRPIVAAFEELHNYIRLASSSRIYKQLEQIYHSLKVEMGVNPQTLYQLFYEMFVEFQVLEKSKLSENSSKTFFGITLNHLQKFTTLDSLFDDSISLIKSYFEGNRVTEIDRDDQIVAQIKEFCWQNYSSDCTLEDMASKVFISKSYLSQIFKEKCGTSMWNYFTDIRVEKAKELLSSTDIKVNRVGEMVGYKNASHFGHIFRSHVGISPKEFQRKAHTKDSI